MKYRIHWKALRTGATGCGTGSFPRPEAQEYADAMNRAEEVKPLSEQLLTHWIEPVEGDQDEGHTT